MITLDDIIILMIRTSVYDPRIFYFDTGYNMEQIAYWMILTGQY